MRNDKPKRSSEEKVLDNLTDFVTNDDDRTVEEIKADLISRGIDVDAALERFHQALTEHAPTWKDTAAAARRAAERSLTSLKQAHAKSRAEIIAEIEARAADMRRWGAPIPAGAYHHRFEQASDEDLQSLLEDVESQYDSLKASRQEDDQS